MLRWSPPPGGIGTVALCLGRFLLLRSYCYYMLTLLGDPLFPPSNSSIPSHLKQTEFFFPFWAEKRRGPPYRYLSKLWRKF